MVHIYEKVPSTYDNEYGIEEITNNDTLKKGPCIIVILGQTWFLSSINGAMKLVSNLINSGEYNPCKRVLGLGFGNLCLGTFFKEYGEFTESTPEYDEVEEFVNNYFLSLISSNNSKIDVITAMKNIRNINFITYCNGVKIYKSIEVLLENKMIELGYSDNEIKLILSQFCLAIVSGDVSKEDIKATTMLFGDINDKSFKTTNSKSYYEFAINGNGSHDFRKYMRDDINLSLVIKLFLNKALDNSLYNYNNSSLIPVDYDNFIKDIIADYDRIQQKEIEYSTYVFEKDPLKMDYLYKMYHRYKDTNERIDIKALIKNLELSKYDKDNIGNNDVILEVAYKNDELIAFSCHGTDYLHGYEILLIVCSSLYRNNGIATNLFNNALININQRGYNNCIIESSKKHDNYDFWIKNGAVKIRTRFIEELFNSIEVSILQISDINKYLKISNIKRLVK